MFIGSLRVALAWVIAAGLGAGEAAARADPADYGALPAIADVEISPDGTKLAMLQNVGGMTAIVFYDLSASDAAPRGVDLQGATARSIQWANDETVLVLVTQSAKRPTTDGLKQMEAARWLAMSSRTYESQVLFGNEAGYFLLFPGTLLATTPDDPDRVVFSRWTSKPDLSHPIAGTTGTRLKSQNSGVGAESLFSIGLKDGSAELIASGAPETAYWLVDADGAPIARVDFADPTGKRSEPLEQRIYTLTADGGELALVRKQPHQRLRPATLRLLGLSAQSGKMLAVLRDEFRPGVFEFNMQTGETGPLIFPFGRYGYDRNIYDAATANVRGLAFTDDFPRRVFFDPAEAAVQDSLAAALPGANPVLWSRSADGARYVVQVLYADHPAQWYLFDKASKHLSMLGATYPALDGRVVAQKEKFDYLSSDGLQIPGYLTVPAGASKRNMPLIVLPHGGPASRDDQAFEWWPFFYAARGYLVYQPNFRGSAGFGEEFLLAGDGQWGRKMQDDITEGVRRLVADGIVDPRRVCIVGGSYGGYAALAGATLTPGVYACAVSVNGISNPGDLLASKNEDVRAYWEERIGSRYDVKALHAISPLRQVLNTRTPIMLIHARNDAVVPIGQSRSMAKALKTQGYPHELVELKSEDHYLSRAQTRTEMLTRSIAFIDRYIGAPSAAAGAGN